jgi:CHAT domain-containing protein
LNSLLAVARARRNDLLARAIYDVLHRHYYNSGQYRLLKSTLEEAFVLIRDKEWPRDRAVWLNGMGLANLRLGSDSVAIDYFKLSMNVAELIHERPLEAKVHQYLGVAYWHVGDLDLSLLQFRESTKILREVSPVAGELAYNYLNAADIYTVKREYLLAMMFAEEASRFASAAKDRSREAQAVSLMAIAKARAGRLAEAAAAIEKALVIVNNTEGGPPMVFTKRLVLSRAGEIAMKEGNPAQAAVRYTQSERLAVEAQGDALQRVAALSGRAEAYVLSGRLHEAKSDLSEALRVIEHYRREIRESEYRSSFLDVSQSVFDQLVILQANDPESLQSAFETCEEGRARSLLDQLPLEKPIRLKELQAVMPERLVLLLFSVTPKATYVFAVTSSSIDLRKSPLTASTAETSIYTFLSLIRDKAPIEEIQDAGKTLYESLISPVSDLLPSGAPVCIVPDKTLHFLPFGALFDESGRFLIQSHPLTIAPSASVFATCLRNSGGHTPANQETMLGIGNPSINEKRFPKMPRLPETEIEVVSAAGYYGGNSMVLTGPQANPNQVLAAIPQADIIHFASHAFVGEESNWQPALLLSPDSSTTKSDDGAAPDDTGLLYLNRLFDRRMRRSRLVVLSACDSGLGRYYKGEGIVSLVRPFIASGVPTVVASLWKIDSTATGILAVELHRIRKQEAALASDALRRAQLRMASGEFGATYIHPYYWAPFIVAGSGR